MCFLVRRYPLYPTKVIDYLFFVFFVVGVFFFCYDFEFILFLSVLTVSVDLDPILDGIEDLLLAVLVKQNENGKRKKREIEDDFHQHFPLEEDNGTCQLTEKELEQIINLLENARTTAKGCSRAMQDARRMIEVSREMEKKQECLASVHSFRELTADIQKLYNELNEFVTFDIHSYTLPDVNSIRVARQRLQRKLEAKFSRLTGEFNRAASSSKATESDNNVVDEEQGNSISDGRCSQLINGVIQGLKEVKVAFQRLSDSKKLMTVDIHRETELKVTFEKKIENLKRKLDDMSASLGQNQKFAEELQMMYQEKIKELNITLQKLENERNLHAETRILLEKGKENTLETFCGSICRTARWWWNKKIKAKGSLMCGFIKSDHDNEYLFVGEDKQRRDNNNHNVFTRIGFDPLGHPCCWEDSQGLWILTVGSDGRVTIKTSYHEYGSDDLQMLYGVNDEEASKWRREVYTWNNSTKMVPGVKEWKLVPTSTRTRMQIRLGNKEFLYPAVSYYAYDKERRSVYTWRDSNANATEWLGKGDWIIDMAACPGHAPAEISPEA